MPCTSHSTLPSDFLDAIGFFVEDCDEFVADDLALGFGIGHAGEFIEETFGGVDRDQMQAEIVAQVLLHFFEFVLAQDAVVDEDAGESGCAFAVAHGAIDQRGGHRRVDAAGESADGASLAYGLAYAGDGGVDEMLRSPCRFGAANVKGEVAQDVRARLGVVDFGVELHRPHFSFRGFDGGDGARRPGNEVESGGEFFCFVAV